MYDFHKIRNELNKNIFEHREFRRDAKYYLTYSGNYSGTSNAKVAPTKNLMTMSQKQVRNRTLHMNTIRKSTINTKSRGPRKLSLKRNHRLIYKNQKKTLLRLNFWRISLLVSQTLSNQSKKSDKLSKK